MRSLIILLALAVLSAGAPAAQAQSRMDLGATIVNGDLRGFYLSLGEYYRVPEREVMVIRDRHIPDYDIPVVLFIAQRAHVAPGVVVDLRLAGRSWMDISLHFGLGPDIYYVPARRVYGPPYGNAYGYYKNKKRKDWHTIRLADDDVVNLVNLRFISERFGHPPEEVMRMRSSGRSFAAINDELRHGRREKESPGPGRGEKELRQPGGKGHRPWDGQDGEGKGGWHEGGERHPGKGRGRD
ncbi:MAG: hypothetical protein ACM3JK_02970 [Betaproteobacteria bacterium]